MTAHTIGSVSFQWHASHWHSLRKGYYTHTVFKFVWHTVALPVALRLGESGRALPPSPRLRVRQSESARASGRHLRLQLVQLELEVDVTVSHSDRTRKLAGGVKGVLFRVGA